MKHLLNNLTEEEKNRIRGQHKDSIKVVTENFSKLLNAKSGEFKPLVSEQEEPKSEVGSAVARIEDVYSDSREDFKFDIKTVYCDPSQEYTDGTVDIDEDEDLWWEMESEIKSLIEDILYQEVTMKTGIMVDTNVCWIKE
jgi:hypothetical protein